MRRQGLVAKRPGRTDSTVGAAEASRTIEHQQLLYAEQYSGPTPHPDYLREIQEIVPGSAEMIFREFELQGTHRRAMERKIVSGNERRATTGQWLGGAIALFFLAAALWLVLAGHDTAGIAIGTVDLGGLVAVFVIGSWRMKPTDD